MEQVDRNRILEHYKDIYEFIEVVGTWEFNIQDCPITLKIKVKKFAPNVYYGVDNYAIKNPEQATPYRSMHNQKSVQEALEDALSGFMLFWKPEQKDQTEFVLDEDW
jgi:hypothetical protein